MEMQAIIYALRQFGATASDDEVPTIYSDSSYCVNSFTNWIDGWKANGWTRAGGKKLENLDLIKIYDALRQTHRIELVKIKGHAGNLYNELADALATGRMTTKEVMQNYG